MSARIGFLCGFRSLAGAMRPYVMHRAHPMTTVLRDFGTELFMYAPVHVDAETGLADGHVIENGRLVPRRLPVPTVNGDWYLGESERRPGAMSRRRFERWCREHGHAIYSSSRFSRLLKDKQATWRLLDELELPQPYTEIYDGSRAQLERFLDRSRSVFLKPARGNRGNGIATLQQSSRGYTLLRHDRGRMERDAPLTLEETIRSLDAFTSARPYVIQEGLESPHEGEAFIFRVITVNDGKRWHAFRKIVAAANGGAVANTSQGGRNHPAEAFLSRHFGTAESATLVQDLHDLSSRVTRMLESRYKGRIIELAFDIVLDADMKLSIVELNTKPGMMKPGLPLDGFQDIFDLSAKEEAVYGRLVAPHATHLAMFLQHKLERRGLQSARKAARKGWREPDRREAA